MRLNLQQSQEEEMNQPLTPSPFPSGTPQKPLMDELLRIIGSANRTAADLSNAFGIPDSEAPIGAVNMICNRLIACAEVVDGYYTKWNSPDYVALALRGEKTAETTRQENAGRIGFQLTDLLVGVFSAIEFQARQALILYPNVLTLDPADRPSWKAFVGRSHAIGIVDAGRMRDWNNLLEIRHMIVHNNGIADRDLSIALSNGFTAELRKDVMTRVSKMSDIPLAVDWITCAYADWCRGFLAKPVPPSASDHSM